MNRILKARSLAASLSLTCLLVLCSCSSDDTKNEVEDLLEDLSEIEGITLDYDLKSGGLGGGVSVKDFELTIEEFGTEIVTFTAENIKVDALEMGSLGFPETLKIKVDGLESDFNSDLLQYYLPRELKDHVEQPIDLEVDYSLEGDEFKVRELRIKIEDVLTYQASCELVDVDFKDEQASLKFAKAKVDIHKKARDDLAELFEDPAEQLEDGLDEIENDDLRKIAEKIVKFMEDPKSLQAEVKPKKPIDFEDLEDLDPDDVVDELRLKVK